jgi:hypothetical protein
MFRNLTTDEVENFRRWARENYRPGDMISPYWHPVTRMECIRINSECVLPPARFDVVVTDRRRQE